jgi:hypothetical protein
MRAVSSKNDKTKSHDYVYDGVSIVLCHWMSIYIWENAL